MFQMSFEEIIERIIEETGISEERLNEMVEDKIKELHNSVSKQGAAHILANQLGVQLMRLNEKKEMKLKNILPGLRNVAVVGRIIRVFEPREWKKDEREGKVGSLLISDGTGTARVVVWDKRVDMFNNEIKEGDIVRVDSAYVKKGNYGPEIHLREKSSLEINPEGVELPPLSSLRTFTERSNISDLEEGMRVSIRGAVVDFLPKTPFFKTCPECNKKVIEQDGKFFCNEHGEVIPVNSLVVNAIIDDGTGNIRCVFFRKNAEELLGKETEELYRESLSSDPVEVLKNTFSKILGKEFVISGRVRRNSFNNYLEIIASSVEEVDAVKEAKDIVKEIEGINP